MCASHVVQLLKSEFNTFKMDVMEDAHEGNVAQPKKYKRKKRKTPLQQARRYGKKGLTGRGSTLSEETYQYLVRVYELSNSKFDTPEEQDIFVSNSFDTMRDEEITYASNQLGCRVIEKLIPLASDEVVMRFIDIFGKDLRPLVSDIYASHVLQKLLVIAGERGSLKNKDSELGQAYDQWLLKCSNFVMNNLEDFVYDLTANHVIRTCLESLAGLKEKEAQMSSAEIRNFVPKGKDITPETKRKIPAEFKELIVEVARRLMLWPQFVELAFEEKPCGLLYTLLIVLKATSKKATSSMVKKLLEECFRTRTVDGAEDEEGKKQEKKLDGSSTLPDVFSNSLLSRLLDAAISVATPKIFTKIYADLFLNNLGKLAVLPIANHQVQKLFEHSTEKLEFEAMYDEIAPVLEDVLHSGNHGVLVSLAKACKRHSTREQFLIREIMKILHCSEPAERQIQVAPLILQLVPLERRKGVDNITLYGSLFLQATLTFAKPIKIVDSLLAMNVGELLDLFMNMKGSHVMDAYMSSPTIGEKSRDKMLGKLKGNFLKLACSKYGSRSLEGMFSSLNLGQKAVIMSELAPKEAVLNGHQYGRIISMKYKLSQFAHRKSDWMDTQEGSNKKRKLFEEILGDLGTKK